MKRMAPITIALALLAAGCASVPFGTMLKLASYDWRDLVEARPDEIRAAVKVPSDISVTPGSATLNASLKREDDDLPAFDGKARLVLEETGQRVITPLPHADDGFHWFVFALDDEGLAEFREFQRQLAQMKENDETVQANLGVNANFGKLEGRDVLPVSIWLKLEDRDDWFALIEDAELELERDASAE